MPVSFRPRHPAELSAEHADKLKRRPTIALRRGPSPLLMVAPAIVLALAVYVGLVYVDKIARRVSSSAGEPSQREQLVRDVDGVVDYVPVLQQAPPPSPEAVIEAHRLAREAPREASREVQVPILIPEFEAERVPLPKIQLDPLTAPSASDSMLEPPAP